MNKFIKYLSYISIGCLIYLFIYQLRLDIINDKEIQRYQESEWENSHQISNVNGKSIDKFISVLAFDGEEYSLSHFINSNSIFVRFSLNSCSACINKLSKELHLLKEKNSNNDIILLISDISKRDLYVNWVKNKKKFKILKIDNFPLDNIIGIENPYIFKINENGEILNHFKCQYGDTLNLQNYLKQYLL